ncbi:MAG: phosphoribosylformimino-5-aminoimidazole carboxamide ribotide isomerase [Pedosphaera sp.]|nr:phosphoribosylformimino-5-aminoimidazole carboxamide ribotide isomerase [Pedosphaera sp.]
MFRPCIDLRNGKVVQIVGGTLTDSGIDTVTRFESSQHPRWYADLYRRDALTGGHVIALGPGNEAAALDALSAWPGGLQYGGGVTADNAENWLEAGASKIIVTSWLFQNARLDFNRLEELVRRIGRERLVLDLSCRRRDDRFWIVTDRWQTFTDVSVDADSCRHLAQFCSEFLIHAADVEGLCRGIDGKLVRILAEGCPLPTTYAGGAKSIKDLHTVQQIGSGRIHLTIGSALDIFGGSGVRYADCVAFNQQQQRLGYT